jgi:hypothetical protein
MDLHAHVLASPERPTHSGQVKADLVLRDVEAGRDLLTVHVEPLGGHVQVDPAVLGRNGQPGFRPQRGLVLHPGLVIALDPDVGLGVRVAVLDTDVAEDVAEVVDLR